MNKLLLSKSDIIRFKTKFIKKSFRECWDWEASCASRGYGKFSVSKKGVLAHRIAYFLHYKTDPFPNLVCHHCDNKKCVNPKHLFLGTHQDNKDDCVRKNRQASGDRNGMKTHPESITWRGDNNWTRKYPEKLLRGDKHWTHKHPEKLPRGNNHWTRKLPHLCARGEKAGLAKLTEKQVIEIRKQYASGKFIKSQLAKIYKVSKVLIGVIIIRKIWKHI